MHLQANLKLSNLKNKRESAKIMKIVDMLHLHPDLNACLYYLFRPKIIVSQQWVKLDTV